jgi:hypothetical protein
VSRLTSYRLVEGNVEREKYVLGLKNELNNEVQALPVEIQTDIDIATRHVIVRGPQNPI